VLRAISAVAVATIVALAAIPAAGSGAREPRFAAVFYYPWYGNPHDDGQYQMWTQNGHTPPRDIYASYFPWRGVYSSSDPRLRDAQMEEIAKAGVDEIVTSWWGRGTPTDDRLPGVVRAAYRHRLAVAVHIEPYPGRTAESVADDVRYLNGLGITDFYVYLAPSIPAADWAAVRPTLPPVRLFAQTADVSFAAAARFDGVYTYDIVGYPASVFSRFCAEAHRAHLLCAPSVGPGYSALKADGDPRVKDRRNGATYDDMWTTALRSGADAVTITSYNEWGEGTQIEPARPTPGYLSYDGAWGLHGPAAAHAYMRRTAFWTARLHGLS
jgi:glycoprotein endo-alpha-1,2-mannosidase